MGVLNAVINYQRLTERFGISFERLEHWSKHRYCVRVTGKQPKNSRLQGLWLRSLLTTRRQQASEESSFLALDQWCLESSLSKEVVSENIFTLHVGKKCRHLKTGRLLAQRKKNKMPCSLLVHRWVFYKAQPDPTSSLSRLMSWVVYICFWKVQQRFDHSKRNVMGQRRETVENQMKISGKYDKLKARSFGWQPRTPLECCLKIGDSFELFSTIYCTWYSMKCVFSFTSTHDGDLQMKIACFCFSKT